MKKTETPKAASASKMIDARIKEYADWRGAMLARLRALIKDADPGVVEEWKWDVPTGEVYKKAVKLTFLKGASLPDPSHVFNSSLEGNARRAIDFREGDEIDEKAFKALIRAAAKLNQSEG